jgi:hypothetical protein
MCERGGERRRRTRQRGEENLRPASTAYLQIAGFRRSYGLLSVLLHPWRLEEHR